jgi:dolichyl-diphosphooligosaccharide--protein glycosyltransferase
MVRLMLVLAPVMCILSGIGISAVLMTYMKNLETKQDKKTKKIEDNYPKKSEVSLFNIQFKYFLEKKTFLKYSKKIK